MKRNNFSDICIILLLYIAVSAIPFDKIFVNLGWLTFTLQIVMQVIYLVFVWWYLKTKTELNVEVGKINVRNSLILLPTLVACFSNLIYLLVSKEIATFTFGETQIFSIVLLGIKALNEEIIFRLALLNNMEGESKIKNIFLSALFFSAMHIVNLVNGISLGVFLQILYTFGLGLLLGVIFYLTKSIIPCIVLHAMFNIVNSAIFGGFYIDGNVTTYILTNLGVALFVGIYVLFILFLKSKKGDSFLE